MKKRQLVLEDGSVFVGRAFGSDVEAEGEVVFNTSMTGYQEVLSDPSSCGQIITFTYPLIGNYGVNRDDFEAIEPTINGLIVKEVADFPSNWRSEESLDELLKIKGIPGLEKIDTRKLTRLIRSKGTLKGRLCSMEANVAEVVTSLKKSALPKDVVKRVSVKAPYHCPGRGYRVVLIDYGVKNGIIEHLIQHDCDIVVVPHDTSAEQILRFKPDGILLSNGPGNPLDLQAEVEVIKQLLGKSAIFGIGLGHQLLALACGAKAEQMQFGHRGANYPVKELATGKVEVTSQNHGYTITKDTLGAARLKLTHVAVNDDTVEGIAHLDFPAFSIQFHPELTLENDHENCPFHTFMTMIEQQKLNKDKKLHTV